MKKATKHFKETIKAELENMAEKDPLFAESLKKEDKTLDGCINYILGQVRKIGANGNTLSMKFFGGFTTRRSMLGGTVRALTEQELEYQIRRVEIGLSDQAEPPELPTNRNENIKEPQLTLFEFAD